MYTLLRRAALLILAVRCNSIVLAEPLVSITSSNVTYHGAASNDIELFENIKYGHDTSGSRRFAPPEPFSPSANSVIDATAPGPACPQDRGPFWPFFDPTPHISEDCLNLRIARPTGLDLTPKSKLPVVVWVTNGGVIKGSANDSHTNPERLIKLSVSDGKPILYVSFNHRLGIFGFARLPVLKDQRSLNNGLRDQRLAFQWLKDNIAFFGGDPERITVYGLSAGATTASLHPMAHGGEQGVPFQQLWLMSGPPGTAVNITSDATTIHTTAVAERSGCGDLEDVKTLDCLRDLPLEDILKTALEYAAANNPPAGTFTFIPSVDGDFLPDRHSSLMNDGKFVKGIPTVLGWTQDDGDLNVALPFAVRTEDDMITTLKLYAYALTPEQLSKFFALYPEKDFEEDVKRYEARKAPEDPAVSVHWFRLSRIARDLLFTCSSIEYGYNMVKHTQASHDKKFSNVRLYDLNQTIHTPLWKAAGMPWVGANHGADSPYIFNGLFPEGEVSSEDQDLSEEISRALIAFAYTGSPASSSNSQKQLGDWPAAFENSVNQADDAPSSFNMQIIGGPYGTGPALLAKEDTEATTEKRDQAILGDENGKIGEMKQVLDDALKMQAMESAGPQERVRVLQQQRLFERCAYIKSLADTLDV